RSLVERLGQQTDAADLRRKSQRRSQCEDHQRASAALSLITSIDSQLTKQDDRQRIGPVSLCCLREIGSTDLARAQADESGNDIFRCVADDACAGDVILLIDPGVAAKPTVE